MSSEETIDSYVTHLPQFRVMVCLPCEACIPPKEPLRHYEYNHTSTMDFPIEMGVRRQVAEYMATLDLCQPKEVVPPNELVPQLDVIKKGYICNITSCGHCASTEDSMRTHCRNVHKISVPKSETHPDWRRTSLQTFFKGTHKKY